MTNDVFIASNDQWIMAAACCSPFNHRGAVFKLLSACLNQQ